MKTIQIIELATGDVVKTIDVSDKSSATIDRIERGVNINLNHSDFYTILTEQDTESTNDT